MILKRERLREGRQLFLERGDLEVMSYHINHWTKRMDMQVRAM